MALGQGVLGLNHRKTFKNLLLQNHLAQMFEIFVALPCGLFQVCSNYGPGIKNGPASRVLG